MKLSIKIFSILIIYCFFSVASGAHSSWQLEYDEHDIKIYLQQNNHSSIKTFKGIATIHAPVDSILSVFADVDACSDWFHYCKDALVIDEVSSTERYHYFVNTVPFPAQNRDFILHSKIHKNPNTGKVIINMTAEPDYCQGKSDRICEKINEADHVRVRNAYGIYLLEPLANQKTRLTWTQFTDPSGHLPNWLVNMMLKNVPLTALHGLQKKSREEKYLHAKYNYGTTDLSDVAKVDHKK